MSLTNDPKAVMKYICRQNPDVSSDEIREMFINWLMNDKELLHKTLWMFATQLMHKFDIEGK